MNKTSIEYCDYTWNPVTGCLHGCSYCYARRFAERGMGEYGKHPKGERFKPRSHFERLDGPAKVRKPSKIFVGSMGDLFGEWVHWEWISRVRGAAMDAPQHTYIWLTKNPKRYCEYSWRENDWVGVSVPEARGLGTALYWLEKAEGARVRFISFEPLLTDMPNIVQPSTARLLDWIIIGAQTGPGAKQPSYERIERIVDFADEHGIPVFLKDNIVEWPVKQQEFPNTHEPPEGE